MCPLSSNWKSLSKITTTLYYFNATYDPMLSKRFNLQIRREQQYKQMTC